MNSYVESTSRHCVQSATLKQKDVHHVASYCTYVPSVHLLQFAKERSCSVQVVACSALQINEITIMSRTWSPWGHTMYNRNDGDGD